jgi:hypothetical protein
LEYKIQYLIVGRTGRLWEYRYKRPRDYRFVEALPKNSYGIMLKIKLVDADRGATGALRLSVSRAPPGAYDRKKIKWRFAIS